MHKAAFGEHKAAFEVHRSEFGEYRAEPGVRQAVFGALCSQRTPLRLERKRGNHSFWRVTYLFILEGKLLTHDGGIG
jgi:hypothetical protein